MLLIFAIDAYIFNEIMGYYAKNGRVDMQAHPIAGIHGLVLAISGLALLIKLFHKLDD